MRWACILLVVAACQSVPRKPWRPPPPLGVEDVATWFMKAALSGDDSTARTLTLRYDQMVAVSNKPGTQEIWDTAVQATLDQLAKEGGGEDEWKVSADVVERRVLEPGKDEKVRVPVEVAIVKLRVNGQDSPPVLFINTSEGWRFSPKK
jgi:hypothetical protein